MRKKVIISVILILILVLLGLISGITLKLQKQNIIAEKIKRLPAFSFMTLNKETFSSSSIVGGPVIVMHFHPECEHCQYEISELFKSNIPGSGVTVILVSSAIPDSIMKFLDQYNVSEFQSVIPLADTELTFENVFGTSIIPSTYVYDMKLNLVKILKGEVKIETLKKALEISE